MLSALLLGIAVVLYAAAFWFGRARSRRAHRDTEFLTSSVTAHAEVIEMREQTRSSPAFRSSVDMPNTFATTDYFPVVRFTLPDGRQVTAMTLRGAHPAPARVGDTVEVRYDPADPRRVVLAHGLAGIGAGSCLSTLLVVALFGMATLVLLVWVLFKLVLRVPG